MKTPFQSGNLSKGNLLTLVFHLILTRMFPFSVSDYVPFVFSACEVTITARISSFPLWKPNGYSVLQAFLP